MNNDALKQERERIAKMLTDSPSARRAVENLFSPSGEGGSFRCAMNYGGEYSIDEDHDYAELSGNFSRDDLLKIASHLKR